MTALIIAAAVLVAAGLVFAYLLYSGARVVRHGAPRYVDTSWDESAVTLPSDDETRADGTYGMWVGDPENPGHLLVGPVSAETAETVTRPILARTNAADAGRSPGRFVGHVFPGPEAIAPGRWSEIEIPAPSGACPAWVFRPAAGDGRTWAIHVHGIGAKRVAVLRSVPAAERLGMTSLVPSFRGDGEGPDTKGGASTLGELEKDDLAAALDYAAANGAERIVVIAWSMGAAVTIPAIADSGTRPLIEGIVLVAPVVDWLDVITAGARRAHLPAPLAKLTAWGLQRRPIAALLGMDAAADFPQLRRDVDEVVGNIPTLVIHSANDPLVPYESSAALAARHPAQVELRRYDSPGHAWEYNPDPEAFTSSLAAWLRGVLHERDWA